MMWKAHKDSYAEFTNDLREFGVGPRRNNVDDTRRTVCSDGMLPDPELFAAVRTR